MVTRQEEPALAGEAERSINAIKVPILVVDVGEDRIVEANEAAAALIPCAPIDLMVLPLSRTLVGDEDHTELRVGDYSASVRVVGPENWREGEGTAILVLLDRLQLSMATMDDGELKDAFARLQSELAETRTLRERLVSVWAHELKTPLTVIQSYLEILTTDLDDGLSQEQLSFLMITKESVQRLRRLVLDLVDLIGFRTGHLSVDAAAVDVASLLDEIVEEMQPLAATAEINLHHERPAVRVAVSADADRVRQIMRNLIDNAFKFTAPGGKVTVRTRVEREWVIVDVVDSGVGIHPTDVERIFEEFVQLRRNNPRRKQRGSGLGLAISQRIAEAHGGAIEVESTIGEGSIFSVRLPREHEEIE